MAEHLGAGPDPDRAVDLAEFVGLLGELRARAEMPSYRVLAKRVGPLMRPPRVVPTMTVADVFKTGRRRLDLDLVVAVVRALGEDESAVVRWRRACIKVHAQAKTGGPERVLGQLPTDPATFTGRREELARLVAAATAPRDSESAGDRLPGYHALVLLANAADEGQVREWSLAELADRMQTGRLENGTALRRELMSRPNEIDGIELPEAKLELRLSFPLEALAGHVDEIQGVLEWFARTVALHGADGQR
ncbi:hypothetical protein ACEZDB_06190 [Streptacidiphilus sp. N1-3]|uniref:DUF222 domain-containing protein n=1 Tax=Streptacidiphilus alkalitolerans TaxID=3342712 RepID=A0ABV6WW33_9ACTN